ncbi:MAG: MaoC family dehydratase [Deltaproteobacteria bacterium]|nr:MaoC family dehydratase [Deltaproteobacteria bacterium]
MFFEEVEVGKIYKSDGSKTVTGTEIDLVAQLAGLDLPGFLDPEAAKGWGFKDRVAPGPYILGCGIGLMAKQGFLADAVLVNVDGLSFKTPVYPRDKIKAETEVTDKKPSSRGGGRVLYKFRVLNQDDQVVLESSNT